MLVEITLIPSIIRILSFILALISIIYDQKDLQKIIKIYIDSFFKSNHQKKP